MEVDDKLACAMFGILLQYEVDIKHGVPRDQQHLREAWVKRVQRDIEKALDTSMEKTLQEIARHT